MKAPKTTSLIMMIPHRIGHDLLRAIRPVCEELKDNEIPRRAISLFGKVCCGSIPAMNMESHVETSTNP